MKQKILTFTNNISKQPSKPERKFTVSLPPVIIRPAYFPKYTHLPKKIINQPMPSPLMPWNRMWYFSAGLIKVPPILPLSFCSFSKSDRLILWDDISIVIMLFISLKSYLFELFAFWMKCLY